MIKSWLIKASAPICGADEYYCAFSDGNPLNTENFPYYEITNDLWNSYSYLLHLDDEECESEDDETEAYDQAYSDFVGDCSFVADEMPLEKIQDYMPGGTSPEENVIYDERE